ncbi:murein hydrolase activator EnvC family protein [Compostibacter hankyongensis]|uniref:murein hydrolase activator EnvC family protein n=1 Tax=Compostibacter hankyongensis TaxID=1007089 RepID=UPI0031F0B672
MPFKIFRSACMIILLLLPALLRAQERSPERAELERKRTQLQQDIEQSTRELGDVKQDRRKSMTQLQLIQNKLRLRNKLIKNINQEINYINGDINKANRDISSLQKDLDTLKAQYAELVVYAYKNHNTYDYLNFILSAHSFNDAIKRFQYLKQYREYRKHQAGTILETQDALKKKIATLAAIKDKRSKVLESEEGQRKDMEEEQRQQDEVVQSLKGHEKELLADINEKKKASRQLNVKIAAVIRQEIEAARRKAAEEAAARARAEAEARKRAEEARQRALAAQRASGESPAAGEAQESASPAVADAGAAATAPETAAAAPEKSARPENVLESTPEALALSENFEANRGRLPWPVAKAIVMDPFGVHKHPVLDKVTWDNDGVTLRTNTGASVRAVFDGDVANVFLLSGRWNVMIRHGQYFTVYANLKDVSVQKGDKVKTMQPIGTAYTDPSTGDAALDFKIYKGSVAVNPETWLAGGH